MVCIFDCIDTDEERKVTIDQINIYGKDRKEKNRKNNIERKNNKH
jgi:hypothetical protein